MSTRTQVKVTNGEQSLTLYHHTDGYPSYMLPLIQKAWEDFGQGWEGARVYKVASMLCAVDPVVFEPLDYHDMHGDIEYFYEVDCKGESHHGAEPVWKITSYEVVFDFEDKKSAKDRLTKLGEVDVDKIDNDYIESLSKD